MENTEQKLEEIVDRLKDLDAYMEIAKEAYKLGIQDVKLYYLNPNEYGAEMFVAARSKEEAFEFFKVKSQEGSNLKSSTIDNLPRGYTIDEHEIGDVVESEIA